MKTQESFIDELEKISGWADMEGAVDYDELMDMAEKYKSKHPGMSLDDASKIIDSKVNKTYNSHPLIGKSKVESMLSKKRENATVNAGTAGMAGGMGLGALPLMLSKSKKVKRWKVALPVASSIVGAVGGGSLARKLWARKHGKKYESVKGSTNQITSDTRKKLGLRSFRKAT